MVGYDNWKSYNYRDNELGSIQDDEPREHGPMNAQEIIDEIFEGVTPKPWIDEDGHLCDREWYEPAMADVVAFRDQCISWRASLERYKNLNPDADIVLPEYRDAKFNDSTNRSGKGW